MKVVVREVGVRNSLNKDFYILDILKKGDTVVIKDKTVYYDDSIANRKFYKCTLPNGDEGYIRKESVK